MPWRPHWFGQVKDGGYLPKRATSRQWKQFKRNKCIIVKNVTSNMNFNKSEVTWRSEEHFDIKHLDAEFEVCPVSFLTFFSIAFYHYTPFTQFWNGVLYVAPL